MPFMRSLKHLSIKSKLILMLLAVSSCSIFVTAYLGYQSGQSNLTERAFSQLTSLRASKAERIESYFRAIRNHTQTLSEDLMVVAAMQEFKRAYQQLEASKVSAEFDKKIVSYYRDEFLPRLAQTSEGLPVLESYTPKTPAARYLQYRYIAANPNPVGKKQLLDDPGDGSEYSQVHARYHPIFRNIIKKFGYYDMFLIAPEGTVVYTTFKETDFTTNFTTEPYNESNLAKVTAAVRQAKGRDYAKVVDFEPYRPSYGAPAAFIATPIFNKSEFIGVLAFQLPVDEINNVMTGNRNWKRDGLGNTGETYLVGQDYLMRSLSRFLVENPKGYTQNLRSLGVSEKIINRISKYSTSILEQKVQTQAVKEALTGKQGTQILDDYRGISVLSSYAPLQIDGLEWVILSEMDLSEAYAPLYSFQRQVLISATLLMLVVTLVAMVLAYIFVKPINHLIAGARRVGAGQIDAIAFLEAKDEFGELVESFNAMVASLRSQTNIIEEKNRENEQLLLSIFPAAVAKRLKRGEKDIAENVSNVSVLFSDLTGFTKLSKSMTAYEVVATLNDLITAFDEATERYGIEKIKTSGDSYMAVCGLSVPYLDHDKRAIDFSLEMLAIVRRFSHERGFKLNIQIGINSGDVVAGIVGRNKFIYDVWGDTINVASEMKSACPPGSILVSQEVYDRLHDLYNFEPIGDMEANGKATPNAWRLKGTQQPVIESELGI
jgi:class 3 adenylate cyclase